ncbi:MAG: phosphoadenosine phosphosulfate reductase family protein [Myxococcota bacterium]|nr:phosphoadenosine phosphosulfate reductase family protein [Myxococcota bacterium]
MLRSFGPIADLDAWRERALETIEDRTVVCSISGGKDSTAMALLLKEVEIPFVSVHLDTAWEHHLTERYIFDYLPTVLGPISVVQRPGGGMADLVRKSAGFPGGNQRFCTYDLKIGPLKTFLDAMEADPINTVGIRSGESAKRAAMPEWEFSDGLKCMIWRPIKPWSEEDVFAMHRRHGVKVNPLYEMGAQRVGCWPCVFARKSEIKMLADTDPERIDLIRRLEGEVQEIRRARDKQRGREGTHVPTWFAHKKASWSIDDVVAWSRSTPEDLRYRPLFDGDDPASDARNRMVTLRDELFVAPVREQGCMRWGMCETVSPDEEKQDEFSRLWKLAIDP